MTGSRSPYKRSRNLGAMPTRSRNISRSQSSSAIPLTKRSPVLAARKLEKSANAPANVRFHALPKGRREEKFEALAKLSLGGPEWVDCATGWREPFLPMAEGAWASFQELKQLFIYSGSGVMPG